MESENLQVSFFADTTPEKALDAICNVQGWWATNVRGGFMKEGDIFTVRFGKTFSDFKIIEFVPNRKLVWLVTDSDLPLFKNRTEWKNTQIVWNISAKDGKTEITMTHVGLTPTCECYIDCQKGWSFYVKESLLKLLAEGQGLPGTGIFSYIFSHNRRYEGVLYFKNDPLPEYPDGFFFLDVKETSGEEVTAVYSVATYNRKKFDATRLQGEYFMIIEDKPVSDQLPPMEDLLKMINRTS